MKGTIRERVKKDGSTVYTCHVEAGRDPATNKRRYRTATAPTRRGAHSLLHELMREIDGEAGRVDEGTRRPASSGSNSSIGPSRSRSPSSMRDRTAAAVNGLVIEEILNWVLRSIGAPPISATPAVAKAGGGRP